MTESKPPTSLTRTALSTLARQVIVGFVWATLAALADTVVAWFVATEQQVGFGDHVQALFVLLGFYLPIGPVVGALSAVILLALRPLRAPRLILLRPFSVLDVLRPDPAALARAYAALFGVAVFGAAVGYSSHEFATRFHAPMLAAVANAVVVVVIALVLLAFHPLMRRGIEAVLEIARPLASPILLVLLFIGAVVVGIWALVTQFPALLMRYPLRSLLTGPTLVVLFLALSLGAARLAYRRPPAGRRRYVIAAVLTGLSLIGLPIVAATYGPDNRVRVVVEDRSALGGRMLRTYLALTDRDHDGVSFAFGGGDCDDSNAEVFPGAPDPIGDGIDSDCFEGDGGPIVTPLGDGEFGEPPAGLPERPNVLFVSIDTLRPDHTGYRGYERETTANVDRFAAQAVRFDLAVAQSSRSIRSIPSVLTGLYPSQIATGDEWGWVSILPENQTVAEVFARGGYQTAVAMGTSYFARAHGFLQGFERKWQFDRDRPHSAVIDRGIAMMNDLARQERPWFLWVHHMGVHAPYITGTETSRYGTESIDEYDEAVTVTDIEVGRLLRHLDELGVGDQTVVVLWSDHGEAFGEHGATGHTTTLYEEELRAVLLMRVPGVEPRVVEERVGLFDVFPTVLNLAGLEAPRPIPSRSLVPYLTDENHSTGERALVAELLPDGEFPFDRKSLSQGRFKIHWWVREGRYELYDIEEDPGELRDVSSEHPEVVRELLGLLRTWSAAVSLPSHQRLASLHEHVSRRPPPRIQNRLDLGFEGSFTLLGYDVDERESFPGGTVTLTFYFRADSTTEHDYQLVPELRRDGQRLHYLRASHRPVNGRYLTNEWQPGDYIEDVVGIPLGQEVPPGPLELTYRIGRGRLMGHFSDGSSLLRLRTVTVRPASGALTPIVPPTPTPPLPEGGEAPAPGAPDESPEPEPSGDSAPAEETPPDAPAPDPDP